MQARSRASSIVITHSWQIPIPQKTPRLSPLSVTRQVRMPAAISAAATVSPGRARIVVPSTVRVSDPSSSRRPGEVKRIAPMIARRAHCNRSNVLRTSRRFSVDPEVMMSLQEMGPATPEEEQAMTTRSGLLRAGGIAALGTAGALALANGASAARAANGSILDKWVSSKKARLGVDLTFPPLQYIDPKTKKPTGYIVELTEAMMKDVGATPEWVQTPFAQLFARSRRASST